ncbi:Hypothetical protein NTJ_05489 [Nesidiocoris tenuis]|uniref:Uncharacterized protein n=1 Tax=Nesidiocoris tenuis TaxID=355587 RepID=A0ABN7AKA2_9HEMI|nr:Hypothetical protein NTJ_05489 [Nesidiocoris tenuis]
MEILEISFSSRLSEKGRKPAGQEPRGFFAPVVERNFYAGPKALATFNLSFWFVPSSYRFSTCPPKAAWHGYMTAQLYKDLPAGHRDKKEAGKTDISRKSLKQAVSIRFLKISLSNRDALFESVEMSYF